MDRQCVDLAYQVVQETPKRVDLSIAEQQELAALKGTVQTSRYTKLEEYLKSQQWQEADQETYRLMITTVGKEKGNGLNRRSC